MQRFLPLALVALSACTPAEPEVSASAGRALYDANCAICHGDDGRGNGALAAGLETAPADLTAIAARNGGTVPKARVLSQIDGYQRRDMAGVEMPEFGALFAGDPVLIDTGDGILTPTPIDLVNLLAYLETIQE